MSDVATAYAAFSAAVGASAISPKLKNAPVVAILHGPKEVIECVVRKAAADSGIEMDWGYVGGHAFIHADGDKDKARDAVRFAMPGGLGEDEGG